MWQRQLILTLVATVLMGTAQAEPGGWSGSVAAEGRLFTEDASLPGQFDGRFQPSLVINLEWRLELDHHQFLVVPFLRLDGQDSDRTHFDLREAYWRRRGDTWNVLVGVSKVFWGVTESRHLVDIINQDDAVEDIDGEDKLGQPMINLLTVRDWGTLDFYLLPHFRERRFPGSEGRLRTALPVDHDHAVYEASAKEWHPDGAVRYAHSFSAWDVGGTYFYGTGREPRLQPNPDGTQLIPHYDLIHQVGVDVQYTQNAWLWKFEGIVREEQGHSFGAIVVGFEYTFYQIRSRAADLGLLVEYLYDGRNNNPFEAPVTLFENDLFFGARLALNDTQDTAILGGVIVDLDDQSILLSIESERRFGDHWRLEIEGRFFLNVNRNSPIGTFEDDSFITVRLSWFLQ